MWDTFKEARDIHETTHEGTKIMKNSKLQRLTDSFEEFRMKDDEFKTKSNDIVLQPKWPKVITIKESKDLNQVTLEELVG